MVQFAIEVGTPLESLQKICEKAEELDYKSIFYGDSLNYYALECWTALTIISSFTKSIRIGPAVTFSLYRHPAVLARASSTLDFFSNGRLDFRMGLGGRGLKSDSDTYGVPFPNYSERVERLDEALTIIKSLWTNDITNFTGKHFFTHEAPRKIGHIQQPHPPITVAGQSRGVLNIVAKHAEVWEVGGILPSEYEQRVTILNDMCTESGRDVGEISKSLGVTIGISKNGDYVKDALTRNLGKKLSQYERTWTLLSGGPEEIAHKLNEYIERGVERFTVYYINYHGNPFDQRSDILIEQMELFRDEVIPSLSSRVEP